MVTDADRGRKAASVSLPAPTLGLNTRDAWAAMDPRYAVAMVNVIPTPSSVDLRKGYSKVGEVINSVGALTNVVQGIVRYSDSSVWVVTSLSFPGSGTVVEDVSSVTRLEFNPTGGTTSYVQFSNAAGNFVVVVFANGDATHNYYTYDGSTWTARTASTTGSSAFRTVAVYRNRLWFTKTSSTSAFYLPTSAITGTPVEFPLGGLMSKGGTLSHIGTWTMDGGDGGSDDYIVFLTSNGQAIVYAGTDPSSQSTWALVGVYDISPPVGKPLRYGADLLLPLRDGLFSMAEILRGNTATEFSVSSAIRKDWQALSAVSGVPESKAIGCYSAKFNLIAFNFRTSSFVVTGAQTSVWLVMDTRTKGWTRFTGLDAYALDVMGGDIYFANYLTSSATVALYKWGTATDDNGAAITGYCQQAYSTLGAPGTQKLVTALKPAFTVTGTHTVGFAIDVDYQQAITTSTSPTNDTSYAAGNYAQVLHYPTIGESLSVFCEVSSSASGFSWYSTGLLTMAGGFV